MSEDTLSEPGAWHAVVIGIDHYPNLVNESGALESQLHGAVNDARAFRQLLLDQLRVPEPNVQLFAAPHPSRARPEALEDFDHESVPPADAGTLRRALDQVKIAAHPGDHLVFYYAGHGLRVSNEGASAWDFGLAASDYGPDASDPMIMRWEIAGFFEALARVGVQVTAFFDCCHAGGTMKGGPRRARGLVREVDTTTWKKLQDPSDPAMAATARGGADGSGWIRTTGDEGGKPLDWVVMEACGADETAEEGFDGEVGDVGDHHAHGDFTLALLDALGTMRPLEAKTLRWMDLLADVGRRMHGAPSLRQSDQQPTIEGLGESLVFGGAFLPFDPGFTVTVTNETPARLLIDGGTIQGLAVGAQLRIYPPGTADFEAAGASSIPVELTSVEPARSWAPVPTGALIRDGSRARQIGGTPPIRVLLTGVPEAVLKALDPSEVTIVASRSEPHEVEVLAWEGRIPAWKVIKKREQQQLDWVGTPGGWVVVPFSTTRAHVTPDDVLAYLPPVDAGRGRDEVAVGRALGRGLAHWARYLGVARRTSPTPDLAPFLEVSLCTGPAAGVQGPEATYTARSPNSVGSPNAGVYEVAPGDHLWVGLRARQGQPGGIFAGVLACSEDGKIELLWPHNKTSRLGLAGENERLSDVELKHVSSAETAFVARVRADQLSSAHTLRVIAYAAPEGRDPVNLESLELRETVQDVIARALGPAGARDVGAPAPSPVVRPEWGTWDLPIRSRAVARDASPARARLVLTSNDDGGLLTRTLSPDGRYELICTGLNEVKLREVSSGILLWSKNSYEMLVSVAAFAPDFSPERPHLHLWFARVDHGQLPFSVWDLRADARVPSALVLDQPERVPVAASSATSGRLLTGPRPARSASFGPEGRSIRVAAWDGITGSPQEIVAEPAATDWRLSPDKRFNLVSRDLGTARRVSHGCDVSVRDVTTGKTHELCHVNIDYIHASFARDGKRLLTNRPFHGTGDKSVEYWELPLDEQASSDGSSPRACKRIRSYDIQALTVDLSPDGRLFVTASRDGITRLWEVESGALVCSLVSFEDGTWAVFDPAGRYDASNGGDIEGLYWMVGLERIRLSQLKARYYEPGLLGKKLGQSSEPLRPVQELSTPELYPRVEAEARWEGNDLELEVTLTDQGGGFGPVQVKINDKLAYEIKPLVRGTAGAVELTLDDEPADANTACGTLFEGPDASFPATLYLWISLADKLRLCQHGQNRLTVTAFNEDRYLSSPESVVPYDFKYDAKVPTNLYAIVCGVSEYAGPHLRLRYAAKDASDFADALRLVAKQLIEKVAKPDEVIHEPGGEVDVVLLSSPTRPKIKKAFDDVAGKATSSDVLVVFLSGHGMSCGGPDDPDGGFYYLTQEATDFDLMSDPDARRSQTISSRELTDWIGAIPALKQVMILDTCHSGRFVQSLSSARGAPANQTRALERLKDSTGMFVLAGSAADSVSYETSVYGQGLLTYSLLFNLGTTPGAIDVSRWFRDAAEQVPRLAEGIGGIQRPVMINPAPLTRSRADGAQAQGQSGGTFPVGFLAEGVRIPLKEALPIVGRADLQDEVEYRDTIGLEPALNAALREESDAASGTAAPFLFIDNETFPGAYRLIGRYTKVHGDNLEVEGVIVRVSRDDQPDLVVHRLDRLPIPADKARAAKALMNEVKKVASPGGR
jgi:uncharacterized caspase-like protein/WD40 repeat protein